MKINVTKEWCEQSAEIEGNSEVGAGSMTRLVRPDILLDHCRYKWDVIECAYFGNEGSCGTYGAALDAGKWIPAWIPTDSADVQWADESFDNPESAIARSHSYFS